MMHKKHKEGWDKEKHYNAKTISQLQSELRQFQNSVKSLRVRIPVGTISWYETHIAYLKMKIAERIGKKGK